MSWREPDVGLGPLEAHVMEVLWQDRRSLTVREVLDTVNRDRRDPLAYTTVMTVLGRLRDKGFVLRGVDGRAHRYEARAGDAAGQAVRDVMERFGDAALARFVDEARSDPRLLRRLRRLVEDEQ